MKAAKARASSAGSSSRNTREKVSCEGAPCGSGTSAESSSALPSENSAISTQLLAPHSVAAKARNRTDAKSWRAFTSRGSWTSRKIEIKLAIRALPKEESPFRIQLQRSRNTVFPQMRFPCPDGRGAGVRAPAAGQKAEQAPPQRAVPHPVALGATRP